MDLEAVELKIESSFITVRGAHPIMEPADVTASKGHSCNFCVLGRRERERVGSVSVPPRQHKGQGASLAAGDDTVPIGYFSMTVHLLC